MPLTWFKEIDSMGKKRRHRHRSPVMYTTTTWRPRHAARSLNQIIKVVAKIHHTWQRHVHVDEEEYDDAAFFLSVQNFAITQASTLTGSCSTASISNGI